MEPIVNEIISEVSKDFTTLATDESLATTINALHKKGIQSFVLNTSEQLKQKLFQLLPTKAEVMTISSETLRTLEITSEVLEYKGLDPIRKKFKSLSNREKRKIGSDADFTLGSVQAITENGEIMIASATGSQLSAYAYASGKIILIVGTQKIVENLDSGFERIYEYCQPLENERTLKASNQVSKVGKLLIINSEKPDRITILFLKQQIGF